MSHRMQVVLEDEQFVKLAAESARTGVSIGGLVRQAVDARFSPRRRPEEVRAALAVTAGIWELEGDGESYVDGLRTGARWDRDA